MRAVVFVALFAVAGAGEVRAQDAAAGERFLACARLATRSAIHREETASGRFSMASSAARRAALPLSYSAATRTPDHLDEATFREYIKTRKRKSGHQR